MELNGERVERIVKGCIKTTFLFLIAFALAAVLSACNGEETSSNVSQTKEVQAEASNKPEKEKVLKNNITFSSIRGTVREKVDFSIHDLDSNAEYELVWETYDGTYKTEDLYALIGPKFTKKEILVAKGTSGENGEWTGSFNVPEGFGGDFTVFVRSGEKKIGQTNFTVDPTFTMTPESGPVGTEITIKVEGLGWSTYMRNWQLTYDNKYTGLVTAISTNGTAEAKIRAAGSVGKHAIRLRTGYLGMPYINYQQSPYPDKPAPEFLFEVTNEKPLVDDYVEPTPVAADGGVQMPELKNKSKVVVTLDKEDGTVGEPVKMSAEGLPANADAELIWNTMRGSRVSGNGFAEETTTLATVKTNDNGKLNYEFSVPDDLGGIPHRIDLKVNGETYGQTYLRILPSIVDISPKSGPVGTKIQITIKGGGWTEFDNAYYLTYDNAYAGYLCAFNSEGDLTFDVVATGDPGHHLIDLYPGIYKQQDKSETDMTLIPQLTYSTDHPGTAIPAIRLGFEVTE